MYGYGMGIGCFSSWAKSNHSSGVVGLVAILLVSLPIMLVSREGAPDCHSAGGQRNCCCGTYLIGGKTASYIRQVMTFNESMSTLSFWSGAKVFYRGYSHFWWLMIRRDTDLWILISWRNRPDGLLKIDGWWPEMMKQKPPGGPSTVKWVASFWTSVKLIWQANQSLGSLGLWSIKKLSIIVSDSPSLIIVNQHQPPDTA